MLAKLMFEVFFPTMFILRVFHMPDLKPFRKKKKSNLNKLWANWCLTIVFPDFFVTIKVSITYNFTDV